MNKELIKPYLIIAFVVVELLSMLFNFYFVTGNFDVVIKIYGRWIPDNSTQSWYCPVHDWSTHLG